MHLYIHISSDPDRNCLSLDQVLRYNNFNDRSLEGRHQQNTKYNMLSGRDGVNEASEGCSDPSSLEASKQMTLSTNVILYNHNNNAKRVIQDCTNMTVQILLMYT